MGASLALTAVALAAAYAVFVEPYWIRTVTYHVYPRNWPRALDGMTIVQLSDLHGRTTAFGSHEVQAWIVNADLVAVTGDLFSPLLPRQGLVDHLNRLPPDRTFFVSGNHDYRRGRLQLDPWVPSPGIVLDNRWVMRQRSGAAYAVGGVPDLVRGRPVWATFHNIPGSMPAILLSHRPDAILEPQSRQFGLLLTGHTHGGQIALPFWGPILRHSRLPRQQTAGLVRWPDGRYVVVSRGLGTSELPVRFASRPEVVRVIINANGDGSRIKSG